MEAPDKDSLQVLQVFRPLSLRLWFEVDSTRNTVVNKTVDGIRCEVADAVLSPDDGYVIWRISGVAQNRFYTETLESARIKGQTRVNISTLKLNPVALTCVPNRIVSRSAVSVVPNAVLMADRVDSYILHLSRPGPKRYKRSATWSACHTGVNKKRSTNDTSEDRFGCVETNSRVRGAIVHSSTRKYHIGGTDSIAPDGAADVESFSPIRPSSQEIVIKPQPIADDVARSHMADAEGCQIADVPAVGMPNLGVIDSSFIKAEPFDETDVYLDPNADIPLASLPDSKAFFIPQSTDSFSGPPFVTLYNSSAPVACARADNLAQSDVQTRNFVSEDDYLCETNIKIERSTPDRIDYPESNVLTLRSSNANIVVQTAVAEDPVFATTVSAVNENGCNIYGRSSCLMTNAQSKDLCNQSFLAQKASSVISPPSVPVAQNPSSDLRPIDAECEDLRGKPCSIYVENEDVYDVMLNQTNVEFNNNKYYLLQLIKFNDAKQYFVWFRWGRVGKRGQNNLIPCADDLDRAKQLFKKKFFDKTKNEFEARNDFVKIQGKYDLVSLCAFDPDSKSMTEEVAKLSTLSNETSVCSLESELCSFIELVCNVKKMESVLKEFKFDSKRSPLGQLTKQQIAAGYAALKAIEDCLTNGIRGMRLTNACNVFYTRIPHDFGMRVPPLISSLEDIRKKAQLLETLTDVHTAVRMLQSKAHSSDILQHPIDRHYKLLDVDLRKVSDSDRNLLTLYLQRTHAPTHHQYIMTIESAFCVNKTNEINR